MTKLSIERETLLNKQIENSSLINKKVDQLVQLESEYERALSKANMLKNQIDRKKRIARRLKSENNFIDTILKDY